MAYRSVAFQRPVPAVGRIRSRPLEDGSPQPSDSNSPVQPLLDCFQKACDRMLVLQQVREATTGSRSRRSLPGFSRVDHADRFLRGHTDLNFPHTPSGAWFRLQPGRIVWVRNYNVNVLLVRSVDPAPSQARADAGPPAERTVTTAYFVCLRQVASRLSVQTRQDLCKQNVETAPEVDARVFLLGDHIAFFQLPGFSRVDHVDS